MRGVVKVVGALVAGGLFAGSASAGFEIVELKQDAPVKVQPAPWVGVAAVQLVGVTQVGTTSEQQPVVKGFAKEVPLLVALKQVVPLGWKAKKAGALDVMMPVSWKGDGRTWIQVLHGLGSTYKFSAVVDWEAKELTVAAAGWKAVPADKVGKAAERVDTKASVGSKKSAKNTPAGDKVSSASDAGWKLQAGMTLRENMEVWSKAADYRLSWAAVDYPISADVTFKGELDEQGGPLYQLVEAFRTAEQPLSISVLGNRIIRVENAIPEATAAEKAAAEAKATVPSARAVDSAAVAAPMPATEGASAKEPDVKSVESK